MPVRKPEVFERGGRDDGHVDSGRTCGLHEFGDESAGGIAVPARVRRREDGDPHASVRSSSASSSTRAERDSRSRSAGPSTEPSSRPARQRACRPRIASRIAGTSSGATTIPAPGLPDEPGRRPVRRNAGEDRPLGGEVLEDLAREHAAAAAARLGDQQQQRLGVALQLSERRRVT